MVGVTRRLSKNRILDSARLKQAYDDLVKNPLFLEACGRGTAGEERVRERLRLADEAFSQIP